jgi:hypothetical protein
VVQDAGGLALISQKLQGDRGLERAHDPDDRTDDPSD